MQTNKFREDLLGDSSNYLKYLQCPVCLDILDDPVIELVNQHMFCRGCITNETKCPICREPTLFVKARLATEILSNLQSKCPMNKEGCLWIGSYGDNRTHFNQCEINRAHQKESLQYHVKEMIRILDRGINPHLKEFHWEIFESYVKEWKFLSEDNREWKWWWWASQPWWEKPCKECNVLWHQYEDEIEIHEKSRLNYQIILLNDQ